MQHMDNQEPYGLSSSNGSRTPSASNGDGDRPLPGPMIRARLPNEQRTTVHFHPGLTVREALEKAMSRRQLDHNYFFVAIAETG